MKRAASSPTTSPTTVFGPADDALAGIREALDRYAEDRPGVRIDLYRAGPYAVRARILDPGFAGLDDVTRHEVVFDRLLKAQDGSLSDLTMLITVAPGEESVDPLNARFEAERPGSPVAVAA